MHNFVGEDWQSHNTRKWDKKQLEELIDKLKDTTKSSSVEDFTNRSILNLINTFCDKLSRINNLPLAKTGAEVLKLLINEANSSSVLGIVLQLLSNVTQMTFDETFILKHHLFDLLNICLAKGAVPTSSDVDIMISLIDNVSLSLFPIYVKILDLFLDRYRTENKTGVIRCSLDILKNFYFISENTINQGKKIMKEAHKKISDVQSIIDALLM